MADHGLLVFALVMFLLLLPKALALLRILADPPLRRGHGGAARVTASVLLETLLSTLAAPVFMIFHARFVIATLFGKGIRWNTQSRGARGLAWRDVLPTTLPLSLLGIAALLLFREISPEHFLWSLPLVLAWISAPFLVHATGKPLSTGNPLLTTPEDQAPPPVLAELTETLAHPSLDLRFFERLTVTPGLIAAILDPHIHAIHMTLLKEAPRPPVPDAEEVSPVDPGTFFETHPHEIPAGIRMALLSDRALLRRFHHEVWRIAPEKLHPVWRGALQLYHLL